MQTLLKSALGALLVVAMALPATAASYGWPASHGDNDWMKDSIGRGGQGEAAATVRPGKGNRASSQPRDRDPATPQGKRRLPAVSSDDAGTGRGQSGIASYYWQPQRVASGGWFNPNAMTAAHKALPFGTKVRVTHQASGRSVMVTINDRGPYIAGRVIDLSSAAAGLLGMKGAGVARVSLAVLGR